MTLILTLGNSQQVVQVSDRRLSSNGQLVDDESSKAGILTCRDARLAFGFTGLALFGDFSTREWLLDALYQTASPDYLAGPMLDRLTSRATDEFSNAAALRTVPPKDKRLSVMFSGYLDSHNPPLAVCAILTNYQDFETGLDDKAAWRQFKLTRWSQIRPGEGEPTHIQRIGSWLAMHEEDEQALRSMLEARKPSRAIIGKAVKFVREMADRPEAGGTIGKQLSVIRVPRERTETVESSYFTSTTRDVSIGADGAWLMADDKRLVWKDPEIKIEGRAVAVPKVGRNHPCPCGSGKKYKRCHGR